MENNAINTAATETATTETTSATTETVAPATTTPAAAEQAAPTASPPADYLKAGYFKGEGKSRYPDPALVGQAEAIAKALAESKTPPSAINKMVRTLKQAARLPYEAQQGALKKLTPQVLDLERKKKAPALLRLVVERNQGAVKSEAEFAACLSHIKDIAIYLAAFQDAQN